MRIGKIGTFDLFPKFDKQFEENARHKTLSGGIFSIVTIGVIFFLIFSEVRYFFSVIQRHSMVVDSTVEGSMTVSVDLLLYHLPCDVLVLISGDIFGGVTIISESQLKKERLNHSASLPSAKFEVNHTAPSGECMNCYQASKEGRCCTTCQDLRDAYESSGLPFDVFNPIFTQCQNETEKLRLTNATSEGCRIHGSLTVPRVSGSLHFLPGRIVHVMGQQRYDPIFTCASDLNFSHSISTLTFGEYFPGQLNPLQGATKIRQTGELETRKEANGRFSYFLQIIPTIFEAQSSFSGETSKIESQQYSATYHYIPCVIPKAPSAVELNSNTLQPGVFISYDLSPIKVAVREQHPYSSVIHLILQLCAVCGGILTVAGIIDTMFFRGVQKIKRLRKRI